MNTPVVRRLQPSDAAAVAALIRAAFAEQGRTTNPPSSALKETAEIVAAKLAAGGGAGVELDGEWIGAVLWAPQDGALYLGRLAVAPSHRGRGIAGRLLQAVEDEARRRGDARLRLNARFELPFNQQYFARRGFVETGRRPHPGFTEPTIVLMEKDLT
jgi:predicted N-acetyltransferase YhbS